MGNLIICDKNKELISKLKQIIKTKGKGNQNNISVSEHSNLFEIKAKKQNLRIVTASNPNFKAGGGLDYVLANMYPKEWEQARQFRMTDNLFFVISCNEQIKATPLLIRKALIGINFALNSTDLILTGIGTGIAGLSIDEFCACFELFYTYDYDKYIPIIEECFNTFCRNNLTMDEAETLERIERK